MRITAAKARELAGPIADEIVDSIMPMIENAAVNKLRMLELHDEFWIKEGYAKTPKWKECVKQLEDLGFVVEFFYSENEIGKDMYTIIKW